MTPNIQPAGEQPEAAEQLQRTLHHLGERVKELTALHTTARLFQEDDGSTEQLLTKLVALLPVSWQFPDITAARIRFDELEVATPNYRVSPWVQHADFVCQGDVFGLIEVVYLEERPFEVEGPFLAEERSLINSLAEMLAIHLDRKHSKEALQRAHDELEGRVRERTAALSQANDLLTEEVAQRTKVESRLEQVIGKLQRSHDDLQAMMNQLSIGVALTDRLGTILFLNRAAQHICQKRSEQYVGKHWKELFGDTESLSRLEETVQQLPQKRESILVNMPNVPGGRISWANVDICDDPRDSQQKIFYLYDMSEVENLRRLLGESGKFQDLIGKSQGMQAVFQQIHELARVDSTVLIEGETGTGKELVARAIHRTSHRKERPFVAVNCAGLTESLVASQLFGHKRGAFTGAVSDQTGLFEAAEGGTLFLDEIGDIPLSIQTSLLRVLQEREVTRLGESKLRKINVRVIAATHHHLADDVEAGEFRADLLYRIRVGRVLLPPLRERREDIPLLSSFFLGQCQATTGRPVNQISHEAVRLLVLHHWPGNVRELQHAIEFAVIRSRGPILQPHDFPPEVLDQVDLPRIVRGRNAPIEDQGDPILSALEKTGGNRSAAAKLLGISRVTLYRRLSRLGIK
ncbi:MAG: hypothetical protein NPIRA02_42140 [Nitrospirales bacterium]|nr:MAG: hypothetical protein NPIRA02_42140 [Nitrospirales bacterium]